MLRADIVETPSTTRNNSLNKLHRWNYHNIIKYNWTKINNNSTIKNLHNHDSVTHKNKKKI